jgi:hypothetical protein
VALGAAGCHSRGRAARLQQQKQQQGSPGGWCMLG